MRGFLGGLGLNAEAFKATGVLLGTFVLYLMATGGLSEPGLDEAVKAAMFVIVLGGCAVAALAAGIVLRLHLEVPLPKAVSQDIRDLAQHDSVVRRYLEDVKRRDAGTFKAETLLVGDLRRLRSYLRTLDLDAESSKPSE
jgi:hypothetical protein